MAFSPSEFRSFTVRVKGKDMNEYYITNNKTA